MSEITLSTLSARVQSTPEMERLYKTCATISQEGFVGDVAASVTSKLSASLKDAFRFMTTWDYAKPEIINASDVYRLLKRTPYIDITALTVTVPVGFTGLLYEYAMELKEFRVVPLLHMQQRFLKLEREYFAYYLDDPENLQDKRQRPPVAAKSIEFAAKQLEVSIASEGKWMKQSRTTEVELSSVYQNNDEIQKTMTVVNEINQAMWQFANPKTISKEVEDLLTIVRSLVGYIEANQDKVSKVVTQALVEEITMVSRWVEWYSTVLTRLSDLTNALKHTEKKLLRAL